MTSNGTPLLDQRTAEAMVADLLERLPGYTPGWLPTVGKPSWALIQIYGRYLHALAERLNRAPDKNKLAFYDLLGINLLPAQAAVAPVVFKPIPQIGDGRVPVRTQVAATVAGRDEPLVFETKNAIALAAADLVEVVTLWPGKDAYADHSSAALGSQPFTLFNNLQPLPHELYLAHGTHFALAGQASVELHFELARPGSQPLGIAWEYWDGEVWRAFKAFKSVQSATDSDSVDGTDGLTRSGILRLAADCASTKPTTVNGIESYWVRGRLIEPIPPTPGLSLPLVDRIAVRTAISNAGLLPDSGYVDSLKLELDKTFFPLGQQPQPGVAFYLSSQEAFSKPGALVTIAAKQAPTPQGDSSGGEPVVVPEYWNGARWIELPLTDTGSSEADKTASLTFVVPKDIAAVKVNGVEGYWLRARLVSGGFIRKNTITWTDTTSGVKNEITVIENAPPAATELNIRYEYRSPLDPPVACVTYNDFQWFDRSAEARWRGSAFEPFSLVADRTPTLYLGFARTLPADLISFYLDVQEVAGQTSGPLLRWEYYDGQAWLPVTVQDETNNLVLPGMIAIVWPGTRPLPSGEAVLASGAQVQMANIQQAAQFQPGNLLYLGETDKGELVTVERVTKNIITLKAPVSQTYQRVPLSLARLPRFGTPRTWLRARLQSDGDPVLSQVNGLFVNAVWAEQIRTFENEALGASTGQINQTLFFRQTPVLAGEIVEVRELVGPRAAVELPILRQELAQQGLDDSVIRTVADPRTGQIIEVWVRWAGQPHLFFSGANDRHYMLERSRGRLIFGDNRHGRIPPAGPDNIRARTYRSGGGQIGNVSAGLITQLLSGVPAAGVTNPGAAEGGADGELVEDVQVRAPAVTRHRYQAISLNDYEALAREASPAIAVARALPTTHPSGRPAAGWVKLIIMPHSQDAQPQPSFGLRRQVERYLAARIPAALAGQISVVGPDYLPIGVEAVIAPVDLTNARVVLDTVNRQLATFLHPLSGGPDGTGWPFGRSVFLSDVAAVLEAVPGVDYVQTINLLLDNTPRGEFVTVPPDRIVVAGTVRVTLAGGEAV